MDKRGKVERRRQLRRTHRTKIRRELLISEYIQHKYFDIYSEAVQFYNMLNNLYPTKYDLKKTHEYKVWKSGVTANVERARKPSHVNIQTPVEIHPQAGITVTGITLTCEEQPETPGTGESQPSSPDPSEQPETPGTGESQPSSPDPSEQPETPGTGESRPSSPDPSEQPETPGTGESRPSSPDPSEQPETPGTGESRPSSPIQLQSGKHVYTDNLRLRIPLFQHKSPTNHPAVTVKTLQTITEEILEEGTLQPSLYEEQTITEEILEEGTFQPSLYEELAPDLIEKIINELRSEPGLQDIFTSIEQQLEFEQLGMDIDIPEHGLLENELENWENW